MKTIRSATIVALFTLGVAGSASAFPLNSMLTEAGSTGGFVVWAQNSCDDLRRACLDKDAIGEQGQGNYWRYRDQCGPDPDQCARMLEACIHKTKRGLEAKRSCRHYRFECSPA